MSNSNFCTSIICFQFPHQGTYKKNTGIFLKFPLFCHAIKEIQSRENSYLHIALDFLVENILT